MFTLSLGTSHAGTHPLGNERALELCQAGHDAKLQPALRGGGVGSLAVADEGDAQALELGQSVDELAQRSGEAIVLPHQEYIELPPACILEHGSIALTVVLGTAGVIDVLGHDGEASTLGVLAQRQELGVGVLSAVDGRDPGVDGGALHIVVYSTLLVRTLPRLDK